MALNLQQVKQYCPDLDENTIEQHLNRLPEEYHQRFDAITAANHLKAIHELRSDNPARVFVEAGEGARGDVSVTVVAFDHPFEFSLITGMLASAGVNIAKGNVYTLAAKDHAGQTSGRKPRFGVAPARKASSSLTIGRNPHKEAVILDTFFGQRLTAENEPAFEDWARDFEHELCEVLALLDKKDEASITEAKKRVNERVTTRLASMSKSLEPTLLPVELDLQRQGERFLRLTVTAQDTPAYLYALTTALSLHGVSIHRVRIETDDEQQLIRDELDLLPPQKRRLDDPRWLEQIKLSALLTKQFTYFLERSPDPYAALTRFEKLTEHFLEATDAAHADDTEGLVSLTDPRTMRKLAKVLGTSEYLWEDFIRGQSDTLHSILTHRSEDEHYAQPIETTPARIEEALQGAVGLEEQRDRLNRFKQHETFLLDLDHILNPAVDFRRFSERLTFLAENLIAASSRLVYDDLVRSYGPPRGVKPLPAGTDHPGDLETPSHHLPYAIFGLGKLGGVALGYASDIELLFVYDGEPTAMTQGGKRRAISLQEFFDTLTRETSNFIRTKHGGIFEVDLRLRPYGKEGPLASSFEQFKTYYDKTGPAHPFEKIALVRLRWIAGNSELGYGVEKLRDRMIYDEPEDVADLEELWRLWARAKQEKLDEQKGRLNAKYSHGALVDLEGTIQLLQVQYARRAPQLRVPRLLQAMESLHRAGVLNAQEYSKVSSAYKFLRMLINALRVLRGNAKDLFLPDENSLQLVHLARRMDYTPTAGETPVDLGRRLLGDFAMHTGHVKTYIRQHFDRPPPGDEQDA